MKPGDGPAPHGPQCQCVYHRALRARAVPRAPEAPPKDKMVKRPPAKK